MSVRYVESLFRAVSSPATRLDLQSVLTSITAATHSASAAPLDHLYARIGAFNGPFFPCGWGNLSVVNYEEDLRHLIQKPPASIKLSWRLVERGNRDGIDYLLYEGTFKTPCLQRVFDALPPESRTGRVQLLMPARLQPFAPDTVPSGPLGPPPSRLPYPFGESRRLGAQQDPQQHQYQHQHQQGPQGVGVPDGPACVIHLAATGDQAFGRRVKLGFPLLKDNVCSMVLESPFYGARRPAAQRGSKLLRVSDLLTLGWATIAESINLLHWAREEGYGALGMCGLSMGGVHACMAAGLYPGDVAVTPLLAPRSAAVAYCDGAMRAVMAWAPLLKETDENDNRISQVLRAAGRPVTVQLPVPPPPVVGAAPGLGAADAATTTAEATVQSVALMREATYALENLELQGERRHLAEAAAGGSTAAAAAGGGPDGTGAGAGASVSGSDGTGVWFLPVRSPARSGGGSGVLSVLPYLQSVSIMDLYGRLVDVALRRGLSGREGGGGGGGDREHGSAVSQARQTPASSSEAGIAAASRAGAVEAIGQPGSSGGGPSSPSSSSSSFSDLLRLEGSQSSGQQQQQQQQHRPAAAVHWQHSSDSPVHRPHPQPHGPDMPFPQPHQPASTHAAAPSSSVSDPPAMGSGSSTSTSTSPGSTSSGGTPLGRRLLGDFGRAVTALRSADRRMDDPVTVMRLKSVLETYTDVTRYPRPRRTDAAVIVAAQHDAYVAPESVRQLHRYWSGSELRMVSGGHVSAFLMHQDAFRGAIRDSLSRLARPPRHPQQTHHHHY